MESTQHAVFLRPLPIEAMRNRDVSAYPCVKAILLNSGKLYASENVVNSIFRNKEIHLFIRNPLRYFVQISYICRVSINELLRFEAIFFSSIVKLG